MPNEVFTFSLTLDELVWLSSAFGSDVPPLPLLTPPPSADPQAGLTSLQARGLIRPLGGARWQVDRLPAALIHWSAAAPTFLALQAHPRRGGKRRIHLFAIAGAGLWLEQDSDDPQSIRFSLYDSRAGMLSAAARWVPLPSSEPGDLALPPLPDPFSLLPLAWRDPAQAERVLETWGIAPQAVHQTLAWIATLTWAAELTVQQREGENTTPAPQWVLGGNERQAWGGIMHRSRVPFRPFAPNAWAVTAGEMLQVVQNPSRTTG